MHQFYINFVLIMLMFGYFCTCHSQTVARCSHAY